MMEHPDLADLSRRDISKLLLPQELKSCRFSCVQLDDQKILVEDPFALKCIPNAKDIDAAIDYLRSYTNNKNGKSKFVIEFDEGYTLDMRGLQRLQSYSTFRNIQVEIRREDIWLQNLSSLMRTPFSEKRYELRQYAAQFISLIQTFHDYKEIESMNLRVCTLKELVGSRYMSDTLVSYFMNKINRQSKESFCFSFLEEFQNASWSENFINRCKKEFKDNPPKTLIIFLNVGKFVENRGRNEVSETFIGEHRDKKNKRYTSNHYSMLVASLENNEYFYCDTCGWAQPPNLKMHLVSLLNCLSLKNKPNTITECHSSNNIPGRHSCLPRQCATFYPLQSCGNICGIAVIVCASLASFSYEAFRFLTSAHVNSNVKDRYKVAYLKNISDYGYFLRTVLMKWCIENTISISDIATNVGVTVSKIQIKHQRSEKSLNNNKQPSSENAGKSKINMHFDTTNELSTKNVVNLKNDTPLNIDNQRLFKSTGNPQTYTTLHIDSQSSIDNKVNPKINIPLNLRTQPLTKNAVNPKTNTPLNIDNQPSVESPANPQTKSSTGSSTYPKKNTPIDIISPPSTENVVIKTQSSTRNAANPKINTPLNIDNQPSVENTDNPQTKSFDSQSLTDKTVDSKINATFNKQLLTNNAVHSKLESSLKIDNQSSTDNVTHNQIKSNITEAHLNNNKQPSTFNAACSNIKNNVENDNSNEMLKDRIDEIENHDLLFCEFENIERQEKSKFKNVCENKICSKENYHIHCKLCNVDVFPSEYYINRHLLQVHLNTKHCVKYKSLACIPCRNKLHTTSSSTRKVNHYHCPVCTTTILQKKPFVKHLDNHFKKNTSKSNHSVEISDQCAEKDDSVKVLFRPSDKTNCEKCGISLRNDSLQRHMEGKHLEQSLSSCICVDVSLSVFMVPKTKSGAGYPLHVQKLLNSKDKKIFCENNECMQYMSICSKSNIKTELCQHLLQVSAKSYNDLQQRVLDEFTLESMGPDTENPILKLETINKCKELNQLCLTKDKTPVVLMEKNRFLHFSVFTKKIHYNAKLQRFIATYDKNTGHFDCGCCLRNVICVHKAMSMWYMTQYNILENNQVLSQTTSVTKPSILASTASLGKYPPTSEKELLSIIEYLHKYKKYDMTDITSFAKFDNANIPLNIIPVETRCHNCDVALTKPIQIHDAVTILTLRGILSKHVTYVKQCPSCKIFYRYQEYCHGIHNYNDRFFLGLDICLFIREHIQQHNSIGSFVQSLNSMLSINVSQHIVLEAYFLFDVLMSTSTYDFYCVICGYHPPILISDLNKKIAFKCSLNDLEGDSSDDEDDDKDKVCVETFWKKVELNIISKAFPERTITSLDIKPNLKDWAPYLGVKTRIDDRVFNTEHRKINKQNGKMEPDCREMTEERILEILSNDSLKKVKGVAKICKVPMTGSKIDIISNIKRAISVDNNKFKKIFNKMWGHSGGWLTMSCPHGVVYYLKFLLRSESCRDYVDGLLSMKHLPNVVIIDMAHIVARHANQSRNVDTLASGKGDPDGNLFHPFDGRVADPEDPDKVAKAIEGSLSVSFPWLLENEDSSDQEPQVNCHPITGSNKHLCLFDRFHESNTSSEIESLRKITCIPELNSLINTQVEEQLHLKFDRNKHFMNLMGHVNHIYLLRSLLNYHNIKKNKSVVTQLKKKLDLPFKYDETGRILYDIVSDNDQKNVLNLENEDSPSYSKESCSSPTDIFNSNYVDSPLSEMNSNQGDANTGRHNDKISVSSENENETKYIPPKMAADQDCLSNMSLSTDDTNPSNNNPLSETNSPQANAGRHNDKISVSSENENETKYIPPKMAAASLTNITTPENPSNNQRKRLLSQNINTGIVYKKPRNKAFDIWVADLNLSSTDKQQILSGQSLNHKVINAGSRKVFQILPSKLKIITNGLLDIKKRKDLKTINYSTFGKQFCQILELYEEHWIVITNIVPDNIVQQNSVDTAVIYIYDFFKKSSYRTKKHEIKYPISFIFDCCDFLDVTPAKIKFKIMDVCQSSNVSLTGFYAILTCVFVTTRSHDKHFSVKESLIKESLVNFYEIGEFTKESFKVDDNAIKQYLSFEERLYCHCNYPDTGERMKSCDRCLNWFHVHCEDFESDNSTWYCRYCIGIHVIPVEVLRDLIFVPLCIENEKMHYTLSLVCKKWSLTVNNVKFRDIVHIKWLDIFYQANKWSLAKQNEFRRGFDVLTCLGCRKLFKAETGYWRDLSGCTGISPDVPISGYCNNCDGARLPDQDYDSDW